MEPVVIASLITASATIAVGAVTTYLAYGFGRAKTKNRIFKKEDRSPGLELICPNFSCPEFRELMSKPGKKIIVNTWFYGLDIMGIWLKESLHNEETSIEFAYLDPDSEFAEIRSNELGVDVKKIIQTNSVLLENFISSLSPSMRSRVKIFKYQGNPKITISANI